MILGRIPRLAPLPASFRAFLKLLYTGDHAAWTPRDALDMLLLLDGGEESLGGLMGIRENADLVERCKRAIRGEVSPANCLDLLARSHDMGQEEAKAAAMDCLLSHYHECLEEPAALQGLAKELMQEVLLGLALHCRVRRKAAGGRES